MNERPVSSRIILVWCYGSIAAALCRRSLQGRDRIHKDFCWKRLWRNNVYRCRISPRWGEYWDTLAVSGSQSKMTSFATKVTHRQYDNFFAACSFLIKHYPRGENKARLPCHALRGTCEIIVSSCWPYWNHRPHQENGGGAAHQFCISIVLNWLSPRRDLIFTTYCKFENIDGTFLNKSCKQVQ